MTQSVVTVQPDETIRKVANLMRGRTIGCVPVVKGQRLQGIVRYRIRSVFSVAASIVPRGPRVIR